MATTDTSNFCSICFATKAQYVCPKCGVSYCSSTCYKNPEKHLACSESFFRKCVEEEMKAGMTSHAKDEMAKGMQEILQRFNADLQADNVSDLAQEAESESDSSLDSDDDEDLEKRLQGIDLDDAEEVWKRLTPDERAEFKKRLEKARLDGIEVVADPWTPDNDKKLIQELKPKSSGKSKKP